MYGGEVLSGVDTGVKMCCNLVVSYHLILIHNCHASPSLFAVLFRTWAFPLVLFVAFPGIPVEKKRQRLS